MVRWHFVFAMTTFLQNGKPRKLNTKSVLKEDWQEDFYCVIIQTSRRGSAKIMRRSIRNVNIPPPGQTPGIWTFEDWVVQIPAPLGQNCVQIPHPSTGFDRQMPLLKIKCFQWSTNVAKIFSKGLDLFLVELVFEQIACKCHSTRWKFIRNLFVIYQLRFWYSNWQMFP